MSDQFISLEELNKLNDSELYERWRSGRFPFEFLSCGRCLTMHSIFTCGDESHRNFQAAAKTISGKYLESHVFRLHLEAIYSLRIFYKDLYASNPPEIESEESNVRRQEKECAPADRR
jgi:hypothetical protein